MHWIKYCVCWEKYMYINKLESTVVTDEIVDSQLFDEGSNTLDRNSCVFTMGIIGTPPEGMPRGDEAVVDEEGSGLARLFAA